MGVVEHELKRYDVWREELRKKNKAYILFFLLSFAPLVRDAYFSSPLYPIYSERFP